MDLMLDSHWDLALDGPDLAAADGLRSAVIASLFTDARARADDALPDGTSDRRGWWADAYADVPDDRIGSRLWLLRREKETPEVLQRARTYTEEALAWLIDDGVATAVQATADWAARGVLAVRVGITLPDRSQYNDVFNYPLSEAA